MKKFAKLLVVAGCAAVACAGLAACGEDPVDYKGSYKYASPWGGEYGVNVTVTVEGDTITKVVCADDTATLFNISASWTEGAHEGDLGHDKTVAALPDYLKKFEGKKVADIKAITVSVVSESEKTDYVPAGQPKSISNKNLTLTGATQTSGRIILAVQDALKDVK